MQTEKQTKPNKRYLFSEEYFSENALAIWKSETERRCEKIHKGNLYEKYINWVKNENELAIFTLYAYADFKIPKKFDVIFQIENPENFIKTQYQLTQSIYEGWLPSDKIEDGHKHLCIFRFDSEVPEILKLLHKSDKKKSEVPEGQTLLGFCNSEDFSEIKDRIIKQRELKQLYGKDWWKFDTEM